MTDNNKKLPHWDLSNVYPGLDSPEFEAAFKQAAALIDELETYLEQNRISRSTAETADDLDRISRQISELLDRLTRIFTLLYTLRNYVYCYTSTDSFNTLAKRQFSKLQAQIVRLLQAESVVSSWLGGLHSHLEEVIQVNPDAESHAFFLREKVEQSYYMMSEEEESLANQLSLSGLRAWGNLQGTITSQLSIEFEMDGEVKAYPLASVQNIRRYNPDPALRKNAFLAEIKGLESVREPLAACLNGVTGFNNVLFAGRKREDAIHDSLDAARIDRDTLEAMLSAIQSYFPVFRDYLHSKARRLDKQSLPWWDVFAPVGEYRRTYSWPEAQEFILDNFATFSPELASFAQRAFDQKWIDAEPRPGKRGGAFCIRIPAVEEPRVLCNFDGSLDQVSTIAHELGHAYHIECQRGKSYLQFLTPMTLAETASIFCESIIMNAALSSTSNSQEELAILETMLIGDTQVIVDITSRYLFEKEVYDRRREAELSADEFCEIIMKAQKDTYGNGLDENHLHPYMWAWKPHYYRSDIAFYNYPYAFGLLFSTGLYAIYQQIGPEFVPQMQSLLANTGLANAADLASRFDIDIRSVDFWNTSLAVIEQRIKRYQQL